MSLTVVYFTRTVYESQNYLFTRIWFIILVNFSYECAIVSLYNYCRHHEEPSSTRDYGSRHEERSSHRRSRDRREHRSDRPSGGNADYLVESSSRDRSHRHRDSRRSETRPSGGSNSSSRQQPSSRRSRGSDVGPPPPSSSKRRGRSSPSPLSPIVDDVKQEAEKESADPLAAASAAAANIASRIKLDGSLLEQGFA